MEVADDVPQRVVGDRHASAGQGAIRRAGAAGQVPLDRCDLERRRLRENGRGAEAGHENGSADELVTLQPIDLLDDATQRVVRDGDPSARLPGNGRELAD